MWVQVPPYRLIEMVGCKSPKQKDTAIKLNYQTQVYPLTLIRCRNGNWLHRGSSPLTWTIRLICIFKLQNNFNFNCFAHLGGFDKSSYWWFPCSIDKNKENFECYTFMVVCCLTYSLKALGSYSTDLNKS